MMVTRRPGWAFSLSAARQALAKHFRTAGLEGFGFGDGAADDQAIAAAGAVLDYLAETQKTSLEHIDRLVPYRTSGHAGDRPGEPPQPGDYPHHPRRPPRGLAAGGAWTARPRPWARGCWPTGWPIRWSRPPAICARHEAVEELVDEAALAADLRDALRRVYDVERLLARVTTGRASPRDLGFLGRTLRRAAGLKAKLTARRSPLLSQLEAEIDLCVDLRSKLDAALADDCPLASREGGFIRDGFHPPLDALRELAHGGKQWIARYQAQESQRTGIPTLKVGFNKVFGYYIEITNAHRERIPDDYIRKQTVKNAERYITPELKEYEEKVLDGRREVEGDGVRVVFGVARGGGGLAAAAARRRRPCWRSSTCWRRWPSWPGSATTAGRRWSRSRCCAILDGRHPVLDVLEPEGTFVPNDVMAGGAGGQHAA